ncbi:MAG: nucleoside phosphorylase [Flavobacteriales bacterium]|nr:nucleoside phosphorylase [Flavobacteriales bacterium]
MKCKQQPNGTFISETELILRPDGTVYHLGIDSSYVAPKVIIVGDPERVDMIANRFDRIEKRQSNREFVVVRGDYRGKDLTVVSSGIGVDNIDIVLNELDAAVHIDLQTRKIKDARVSLEIVRIGTTGSLRESLKPGTFIASAWAIGMDNVPLSYDATMEPEERTILDDFNKAANASMIYAVASNSDLLARIGNEMTRGITLTANGFYGPQGRSLRLLSREPELFSKVGSYSHNGFEVTNLEMECSGIYALSSMLGHRALTVCVVLANRVTKEFHKTPSVSIESLVSTVLERI